MRVRVVGRGERKTFEVVSVELKTDAASCGCSAPIRSMRSSP
jgi:hypothetical protein